MRAPIGSPSIRDLDEADIPEVVQLSLRAWAPVFASFEQVLGPDVYRLVYPDWRTSQAATVTKVCRGEHVFVAELGASLAGFVAVVMRDDHPRMAEIDMIAVNPEHQRGGVASALIAFVEDFMRASDVVLAEIGTGGDPGHGPARRAYEKAGFTPLPLVRYYKAL